MVRRYKRNPDTGTWIFYGGIVVAAYFAWQWLSGKLSQVPAALKTAQTAAANAVTNVASNVTGQNATAQAALGPTVYHTVAMPDGSNASIASTAVDANGNFIYNGNSYSLSQNAAGYYVATMNTSALSYSVITPSGVVQVPASSVSGGSFVNQGASYLLVDMPDGTFVGLFPSSLDSNSDFIYWNDGVTYTVSQAGNAYVATVAELSSASW
jgi:hypothetical protein